ncbi:MAG: M61 family metallopeptidase [Candidatus Velthaea sp.]
MIKAALILGVALTALGLISGAAGAAAPEILSVDGTDAPHQVWHAHLRVPLAASGDVVLVYPKWIPGSHGPNGPIANLASLSATAGGTAVRWTRDPNDVYALHFAVPPGAAELDVRYDFFEGGAGNGDMTEQLAVLDWNQVMLYPKDADIREVSVQADITLPDGWSEATALPLARPAPFAMPTGRVAFAAASLERLIDSPLYCGAHERVVPLVNSGGMTSEVDLFGQSEYDITPTPAQIASWRKLVAEADALYGARHWRHYHYLVTLSDAESGRGLEHHESSANGLPERYLTDPDLYANGSELLPHEYTHSWNGKYRRPVGLMTKNYQEPMIDDLLWVYEGMTQYFGVVLASRSGLAAPGSLQDAFASYYANLDLEPGRLARPLLDTARAQGLTRVAQSQAGRYQRRGEDYYTEAALMWLDADTLIRERTRGAHSLDDFARLFFGGRNTPPMVVGYTRDDVIAALNAVLPYDWAAFLRVRVDDVAPHPPGAGFDRGGWRFVYGPERTPAQVRGERANRGLNATYSLGSNINGDGTLPFTIETMPLARAGVSAGAKILAVNDRAFSAERLRLAIRSAQHSRAPIRLIVDDLGAISTHDVDYYGGERYPRLVRIPNRPDLLAAIAAPRTLRAAGARW